MGDIDQFRAALGEICSGSSSATARAAAAVQGGKLLEELAELRPPEGGYRLNAIWRDGDVEPHDYQLVVQGGDGDGEFVDVAVSAACVVQESLRRQAAAVRLPEEHDEFEAGGELARRSYCAAWAEGCGGLLDDVDFSAQFVRAKAAELRRLRETVAELSRGPSAVEAYVRKRHPELFEENVAVAELRQLTASYELRGVWPDGEEQPDVLPDRIFFVGEDGKPEPRLAVDARPLLDEVLRRQAMAWCRGHENTEELPLEQLLALVPRRRELQVVNNHTTGYVWHARWSDGSDDPIYDAHHPTDRLAAIRAVTLKLLGLGAATATERPQLSGSPADLIRAAMAWADWRKELMDHAADPTLYEAEGPLLEAVEALRGTPAAEPRQTCGTCQHWRRDDKPATRAGARPCGLDRDPDPAPRHPESSCGLPGCYKGLEQSDTEPAPGSGLPGVSVAGNVIRSEGDKS